MTAIRDAATVVIARDAPDGLEVLLVRRHARAAWLGDLHVFPGGAVDDEDRSPELQARLRGSSGELDPSFVVAAARETFEECGVLFADWPVAPSALAAARQRLLAGHATFRDVLEEFDLRIDAEQLRFFSRWITPPIEPRRFDARFFVARAPSDQVAEADAREVVDGRWLRPADALAAFARGELGMIFPTITHLERIAPFATVAELLDFAARKRIATVQPNVTEDGLALPPELVDAW